uniref:G_PROTEIN_RECEP_F1_2 domain-containing protein n=1 Tax=Panagrellus redivivus TaxID=6233 RepID=A0A7E4VYH5_PANRE
MDYQGYSLFGYTKFMSLYPLCHSLILAPSEAVLFHDCFNDNSHNNYYTVFIMAPPQVTANPAAPPSDMVLGSLLSIQHQIFNTTNNDAADQMFMSDVFSSNDSLESDERGAFIPIFELVLGTVTYLVIITMTVIGNILVVVAVFSYRPLKKVQNYFLVSLAASDLAVAIIVMPLHVVKFLANGRWLLGITMCQLFTTADILLCTSSILNLCAIALDRYFAIHDPLNYAQKRTLKFVCINIILVWIVSAIISIPPMLGWNDWSSKELADHCELTTEKAFVVFSASGSFFVPLAVMIIVYLKIFISARQRIRTNRGRSALTKINKTPSTKEVGVHSSLKSQQNGRTGSAKFLVERTPLVAGDGYSGLTNGNGSSGENQVPEEKAYTETNVTNKKTGDQLTTTVLRTREKISVAKEKRAAKTIAVIIFVFTFCWLPFFCAYLILPFCPSCHLHPKVHQAFVWLGYINSSLNPFLYGILNLEFRRAFRKILCPKSYMASRRRSTTIRRRPPPRA